jgi:hypothetical protein
MVMDMRQRCIAALHLASSNLLSEAVARDIIGHESAEVSRHYTHVDEASKRTVLSKLPDLGR